MQALPKAVVDEGPLTPSPIFDSMVEYRILGRSTCNPVAVVDGLIGEDITHLVFTVSDVLFEIAKRDMVGDSTLIANIILEDLRRNRQCNCHKPSNTLAVPATESAPVHYFAAVEIGSVPKTS